MTFELTTTADANPKTYAASIDFAYEDERGKSMLSEAYQLPIRVQDGSGGGILSVLPFVGLGLVGVGATVYVRRRGGGFPWNA